MKIDFSENERVYMALNDCNVDKKVKFKEP